MAVESACDAGGFDPAMGAAVAVLSCVPFGLGHAPPLVWVGLQTRKVIVPVGAPAALDVAVTTAWSVTELPKMTSAPDPTDGVVTVVVGIGATSKHSTLPSAVN